MWFRNPDLVLQNLFAILVGLVTGAILNIKFHTDVVKTSPVQCQDQVVAIFVSNTCPKGTFFKGNGTGEVYVVCHSEQPTKFIIWVSPNVELPDESVPFVPSTSRGVSVVEIPLSHNTWTHLQAF